MIVNTAYMYMGKAVAKLNHLFSNGSPNYNFTASNPGAYIDNTGLVMKQYTGCQFSGVPLQGKTKITVNFINRSYPQNGRFVLYIKTVDGTNKLQQTRGTENQSETFEIAIPERAQIENAVIQIVAEADCTFPDIVIE